MKRIHSDPVNNPGFATMQMERPWAKCLSSLGLGFLMGKMGIKKKTLPHKVCGVNDRFYVKCLAQTQIIVGP